MSIEILPEHPGHAVRMGRHMPIKIREYLTEVLKRNVDLFAWRPEDMKGIDPDVAVTDLT